MGTRSKMPRVDQSFYCKKAKKTKQVDFRAGGMFGSGPKYLAPNVPMKKKKEATC